MSDFKDLFSKQASDYAKFRPRYPDELYRFLVDQTETHDLAWDCATGSGQAALELARFFTRVVATDASEKQIKSATPHPKVDYKTAVAERSGLNDQSVDLITVAQAFHWFKPSDFFAEAARVLKPKGVLAIWSYGLALISPEIDAVVLQLYEDVLGPYWEKERHLVDEGYASVKLPFAEMPAPKFKMTAEWSLAQLVGYLGTWSALQTYLKKTGENPLEATYSKLKSVWGQVDRRTVRWPLALRVGRAP